MAERRPKITAPAIMAMKANGQKVVCVTAYDACSASIADEAGVDIILVGDSVGNVLLGYPNTLAVSLDDMIHHTKAAASVNPRAMLVADLPFGSYQSSPGQAVESSIALVKAGAEGIKLEGTYIEHVREILRAGIPVMGHVGMTPQSVNAFGGFKVQGRGEGALPIREGATALDAEGVFSLVLELIPAALAKEISHEVKCPTIGIGAGVDCDGQVQVFNDLLGLGDSVFKHAKRYAEGRKLFENALSTYADEVKSGSFPGPEHSF